MKHISTSYVERQNLTMRMSMRRFTRLTNGFSKKIENLEHAVAVHFMHYNFARIHKYITGNTGNGSRYYRSRLDVRRNCKINLILFYCSLEITTVYIQRYKPH